MEKLKKKHDHKLTHLLKAFIFSIVMLAPFIAVGSKMLYLWNPNAKDSYSLKQSTNTTLSNEIVNYLEENKVYQFTTNENLLINNNTTFYNIKEITLISNTANYTGITKTPLKFQYYGNQNGKFIHIQYTDNTHDYLNFANSSGTIVANITFNFLSTNTTLTYDYTQNTKLVNFGTQTYLDNTFYYAINQLDTEPLFNWTKDTAIYTVIDEMTTGLEIGTNTLSILLTYWALNTAIYIIFDIIIEMFVKMTHIID